MGLLYDQSKTNGPTIISILMLQGSPPVRNFLTGKLHWLPTTKKKAGNKGLVEHAEIEERLRDLVPCNIVVQELDIVHL
jgi:hypothetical protein